MGAIESPIGGRLQRRAPGVRLLLSVSLPRQGRSPLHGNGSARLGRRAWEQFVEMSRGPGCCSRRSEARDQFAEPSARDEQAGRIREPLNGAACEMGWVGVGLDELGHDHRIGQEVGHGEVFHCDHAPADLVGEPGGPIEREGGDTEPGTFEGHGPSRGEREGGLLQRLRQAADLGLRVSIASGTQGSGKLHQSCVGEDEAGADVARSGHISNPAGRLEEDGKVALELPDPASGEQEHLAGNGRRRVGGSILVALDNRMADELHLEVGSIAGVPVLLEGQDGQQEVVGLLHAPGPAWTRGPHLRGYVLDDSRGPVGSLGPFAKGRSEPQVESAVVDAHDDVGSFSEALVEELVEEAAEGPVAADDLPEADDRVRGEVDGESDPGGRHGGAAGTREAEAWAAMTPLLDEFRGELVATGLSSDQEGMRLRHGRRVTERRSGRNCGVQGSPPLPDGIRSRLVGSWHGNGSCTG